MTTPDPCGTPQATQPIGEGEAAMRACAEALKTDPTNRSVLSQLAHLLLQRQRPFEVAVICRRIAALAPADFDALRILGHALFMGRDGGGALAALRRAYAIAKSASVLSDLAVLLQLAGLSRQAAQAYEAIVGAGGGNADTWHNLAVAHYTAGMVEATVATLQALLARFPAYEPAYSLLASVLAGHLGQLEAAAAVIDRAFAQGLRTPSLRREHGCLARARALREGIAGPRAPAVIDREERVLLILGQSNAANHGDVPAAAGREVAIIRSGTRFPSIDPLIGSSGCGGSIWSRAADGLIATGWASRLVLLPAARGGTRVLDWVFSIEEILRPYVALAARIDCVLWQQGESDTTAGTSTDDYARAMIAIAEHLARRQIRAPILVAASSYNAGRRSSAVTTAQRALPRLHAAFRAGPELDDLASDCRYDDVHLNARGQDIAAERWVRAIAENGPLASRNGSH
ncbi:MAG: hypothetical protein HYR63_24525 [Proteobacteria bacterium]|nr:hypothetical protein [Pseudomonadota bacterium]